MQRIRSIFALLFTLPVAAFTAQAQSAGSFQIIQHNQQVGTANFTAQSSTTGAIHTTTRSRVSLKGFSYSINKTETLDRNLQLINAQLSGSVNNSPVTVGVTSPGQQFELGITAQGNTTSNKLAAYKNTVFLPDFDPGALQTLLNIGAASNNSGIMALVPHKNGLLLPVRIVTNADQQATLGGQPISVHHETITVGNEQSGQDTLEVYFDSSNRLLQAELAYQGFALVNPTFQINPTNHAPTAPAHPQHQDQQDQQDQQQQQQPQQ